MLTFRDTFTKVNFGPKEGIFILIDNDPQVYKLSCCGSFSLVFFSFIQIALSHTVYLVYIIFFRGQSRHYDNFFVGFLEELKARKMASEIFRPLKFVFFLRILI